MASITNRSAFTVTVPGYRGKDKNKYCGRCDGHVGLQ